MVKLKNIHQNYTPEEVFHVLQEDCRLRSFVDIEVDDGEKITKSMTISDWRQSLDLLPWGKLYRAYNEIFNMNLPKSVWMTAVELERDKTLWDLCTFISQHATKEVVHPIKICGKDCLTAAVFLTLKKNLLQKGIKVESVKPSSFLNDFIDINNFPLVMAVICKMGVKTFEIIKVKLREDLSFGKKMNIFGQNRYCLDTGSIKTFGDLSKRIAEQLK